LPKITKQLGKYNLNKTKKSSLFVLFLINHLSSSYQNFNWIKVRRILQVHMILEESPTLDADPTFFKVFAQLVRESGLPHAEITRRINEQSKFHALYIDEPPFHQSTLTYTVKGRDLPTKITLYRIARLGLFLTEEQCAWLELKRKEETYVNHSTTHARVVVSPKTAPREVCQVQNVEEVIEWIAEKERAGIGD
jgi:hypothetical protein